MDNTFWIKIILEVVALVASTFAKELNKVRRSR